MREKTAQFTRFLYRDNLKTFYRKETGEVNDTRTRNKDSVCSSPNKQDTFIQALN